MPPRTSDEPRYSPQPARRPRREPQQRRREDQVTQQLPAREGRPVEDRVTQTRFSEGGEAVTERSRSGPAIVLPEWRHVITLMAPDIVATVSLLMAFAVAAVAGASSVLFVIPLIVPSVVLGAFNRSQLGQGWRAAVSVNLATMLVLFPLLVIRQSTVRVPYLDAAHGTVYAAVWSTIGVLVALVAIAFFAAWTSRQDPESSPLLFLPAAMLVPLLTSATEFASLRAALPIAGLIFAMATGLTLIASMLPAAYTVFVGPVAVAAEVLFVTVVRQARIFPVGVGEAGMALFAVVIVAAIGLVVMLPAMSSWMQQVEILRIRQLRTASEASA